MKINLGWYVALGLVLVGLYLFFTRYTVSAQTAKELIRTKKIDVILDVRNKDELKEKGFYPNSVNIPMDAIEKELPKRYPDKNTRILVYCATGRRAQIAVDTIQRMGYTNTVFIVGTYTDLI